MWKKTPITLIFLAAMMPCLDLPGVLSFHWNFRNTPVIFGSAILGFLLQRSGALALGIQKEEPKIIAWESQQKAKAKATIRKLEVSFQFIKICCFEICVEISKQGIKICVEKAHKMYADRSFFPLMMKRFNIDETGKEEIVING
ncbi:uncharacterized protein DS421_14g463620 [Arachis hypogaea]|nr:uncharacterized protein DS421_14g463620 [Arachis hypogaea]